MCSTRTPASRPASVTLAFRATPGRYLSDAGTWSSFSASPPQAASPKSDAKSTAVAIVRPLRRIRDDDMRVLERLVPDEVAWVETREDRLEAEVFPVEHQGLGRAVEKRRREFITGRACAREALGRLGIAAVAVPA